MVLLTPVQLHNVKFSNITKTLGWFFPLICHPTIHDCKSYIFYLPVIFVDIFQMSTSCTTKKIYKVTTSTSLRHKDDSLRWLTQLISCSRIEQKAIKDIWKCVRRNVKKKKYQSASSFPKESWSQVHLNRYRECSMCWLLYRLTIFLLWGYWEIPSWLLLQSHHHIMEMCAV